jgi:hypothetical protein
MKIRKTLSRSALALVAAAALVGSQTGQAAANDSNTTKPVAVADVFNTLYANTTYTLTAGMLKNDTAASGGTLSVCSVSESDSPYVTITLKDGVVKAKLMQSADSAVVTYSYTVCENGDTANPSDAVTETINVKHTYPLLVKKLSPKKARYTNDNDQFVRVEVRWASFYHVDAKFKIPPHSSVVVKRLHRAQNWDAWMGSKKIYIGYGDV